MKRSTGIAACCLAGLVVLGFGCGSSNNKPVVAPPGAVDIDGFVYNQIYTCNQTRPGSATTCADNQVADVIQFTTTGGSTYEGRDVPDTGFVYTATMSGLILTWTAISPNGYHESGVWTFSADGSAFSGSSTYNADDASYTGRCNSTGARTPAVPSAPAPVAPCM